uniref:Uncharacterized protein n=1 Tax=Arundo donax TaxID=35708 RepID=A0A0A9T9E1_ARUDO
MIFTRHRCLTLRSASHSAWKLLYDPDCWRLNTLTATTVS